MHIGRKILRNVKCGYAAELARLRDFEPTDAWFATLLKMRSAPGIRGIAFQVAPSVLSRGPSAGPVGAAHHEGLERRHHYFFLAGGLCDGGGAGGVTGGADTADAVTK